MSDLHLKEEYVAIIGDIINSKKIAERKAIQQKFKEILVEINEKYASDIASKFSITLGDEFQGLLINQKNVMNIISEIEMKMSPIELRFGIGIGDINTEINPQYSWEVDGPAYHRARKMMKEMEIKKSQYTQGQSTIMICSQEDKSQIDELLNVTLSVCTALKEKWTKRQKEIIYAYLLHGQNQYKTADMLNIGQPSVNKALRSAKFYAYKYALDTVDSFLSRGEGKSND